MISIKTEKQINDKTLQYISELKRLKSLEIKCESEVNNETISDSGVKQLLDNCPHIRRLVLRDRKGLNISESIESFKQKAKQMPKIRYFFGFKIPYSSELPEHNVTLTDVHDNLKIQIT